MGTDSDLIMMAVPRFEASSQQVYLINTKVVSSSAYNFEMLNGDRGDIIIGIQFECSTTENKCKLLAQQDNDESHLLIIDIGRATGTDYLTVSNVLELDKSSDASNKFLAAAFYNDGTGFNVFASVQVKNFGTDYNIALNGLGTVIVSDRDLDKKCLDPFMTNLVDVTWTASP